MHLKGFRLFAITRQEKEASERAASTHIIRLQVASCEMPVQVSLTCQVTVKISGLLPLSSFRFKGRSFIGKPKMPAWLKRRCYYQSGNSIIPLMIFGRKRAGMGIKLEDVDKSGAVSLEEAIARRRSRRAFKRIKLTKKQLSQLLWSAGKAPSAGATYPLELYAVIGVDCVENIDAGVYHSEGGYLALDMEGDLKAELAVACLRQMFIADAPLSLVIAAEYERTTRSYGDRGVRYVLIEVGHVSQNIYLQCEALDLATVAIGAFHDDEVARVLNLPKKHKPLYVMPVGVSAERI